MTKAVLSPRGKIIRNIQKRSKQSKVLEEGLSLCIEKLSKMKTKEEIEDYLIGDNDTNIDLKEDIARLMLLATTIPKNESPTVDISKKVLDNHIVDINSIFIKEFLELEVRNKANSFMKSDFYYQISSKVEEIELKKLMDEHYNLNDTLILLNRIKGLYKHTLDTCIHNKRLDVRIREPLLELFQYNLDCTHTKMKNGVMNNVRIQKRY